MYTKAHVVYKSKDSYSKHEEDIDLGEGGDIFNNEKDHYIGCFSLKNHKTGKHTFIPFDSVEKIEADYKK